MDKRKLVKIVTKLRAEAVKELSIAKNEMIEVFGELFFIWFRSQSLHDRAIIEQDTIDEENFRQIYEGDIDA